VCCRYQKLLSKRRARVLIASLWAVALLCGFSDFFTPLHTYLWAEETKLNYCELVHTSRYFEEYSVLGLAFVCLVVMLCLYIRIYLKVQHHKLPGESTNHKKDEKRNRRALVTTLLILGSFIVCWLPTCLFQLTMMVLVANRFITVNDQLRFILTNADKLMVNLLLVNCICDAAIYTLRCKEVRTGYRKLLCACCGSSPPGCRSLHTSYSSRSSDVTTSRGKTRSASKRTVNSETEQLNVSRPHPS